MAFSLDHSLTHLTIKEPDLDEIYRSSNKAVPSEEQCQGHLCEAYVCSARENNRFCVYVAFFDTTAQRPVILSSTCDIHKPADQKRLVNEALTFAGSMGFHLEQLKLDYSVAMRQVIMQGVNVMRPPKPTVKRPPKAVAAPLEAPPQSPLPVQPSQPLQTSQPPQASPPPQPPQTADAPEPLAAAELLAAAEAAPPSVPEVAPPEVAALSTEVADLKRALTEMESAKAATEKMAEQTIMAIKLELEKTIALYREQEKSFQDEPDNEVGEPARKSEAGRSDGQEDNTAALHALEEALARETALHRETMSTAEEEAAALRRELDDLCRDMAAERLRGEDELAAARHEAGVVQDTLKNVLKEQQVLVNEREALKAELAVLRESAGINRQQEQDALVQEQERLQSSIERLEHEHLEERRRYESLLAEKELELEAANAELKSLAAGQELLVSEKKLWNAMAGNFKKKAHLTVERLKKEKQALEEKLILMEKAVPHPAPLNDHAGAEQHAMAEQTQASPFAALGLTEACPGFAGFGNIGTATAGGSPIRYAPQISAISYHAPEDIVDLYGSANVVRATPEGRRSQDCSAYVCVVEQGGKTVIHLAWHLMESGEILICLPEKQPEGAGSYARTLQDAVFYFESIGFMMDRVELSRNSHRQLTALEKIGICKMDVPAAEERDRKEASEDAGAMPVAA